MGVIESGAGIQIRADRSRNFGSCVRVSDYSVTDKEFELTGFMDITTIVYLTIRI